VFSAQGISATRFDALVIARCGTGVRPAELRDRLHLPAQTVTGVLDQLEAAGLVRRPAPGRPAEHPGVGDRRRAGALDRICPPLTEIEDCWPGSARPSRAAGRLLGGSRTGSPPPGARNGADAMDWKLEVVVVPVRDVDAAKSSTSASWASGWTPTPSPARRCGWCT
jgi:hypothetical protein